MKNGKKLLLLLLVLAVLAGAVIPMAVYAYLMTPGLWG